MSELVTVVTAFLDLDRENWKGEKNGKQIPGYIVRSKETYLQRFKKLSKIKNPIIVYTTQDMFRSILEIRDDVVLVDIDPILKINRHFLEVIKFVQQNPDFINFVDNPALPEYWNPEYVLLNYLKSTFVNNAIKRGIHKTDTLAWLDFGYCREDTYCPKGFEWRFNTNNAINLFAVQNPNESPSIFKVIQENNVFIQGCHIVAPANLWDSLQYMMLSALQSLLRIGFVDDDQTLLLMSYKESPGMFTINFVSPDDWFVIFKNFNH